jgi:cobalt-zinc-cadmium efflux system outer membrane protein
MKTKFVETMLAGLCLAWLAGCVRYAPKPLSPPDELSQMLLRGGEDIEIGDALPPSSAWFPFSRRIVFRDGIDLAEANSLALFFSPDIVAARRAHRLSDAQVVSAGQLVNPEFFVGPRISTRDQEFIVPASLALAIPPPGSRSAERASASFLAQAREWEVVQTELTVLLELRGKLVDLASLQKEEVELERLNQLSLSVIGWVETLYGSGEVDSLTVHLSQLGLNDAKSALEEKRLAIAKLNLELSNLLGLSPRSAPTFITGPELFQIPSFQETDKLLLHPVLKALEARYQASEEALKKEVPLQYPSITIGPDTESDKGEFSLGFGFAVSLPIFNRNEGKIAEAIEERDAAREAYQLGLMRLLQARAEAVLSRESTERLLKLHREGTLASADSAERSLQGRLAGGGSNVVEVLSARSEISRARIRRFELEGELILAKLREAVAGGLVLGEKSQSEKVPEGGAK